MPFCGDPPPPLVLGPHTTWYHGSPLKLETLAEGSTVTPAIELAKAFSHKPSRVGINVRESDTERAVGCFGGLLPKPAPEAPREPA